VQDELKLIHSAAEGDQQAFEQLVTAYQKQVYNLALRMAGNPEDAMDLSQEAFVKAWRGLSGYRYDSAFSTWLYRLTSNVCIDFLRRQRKSRTVSLRFVGEDDEEQELSLPDPAPGPEERVLAQMNREEIAAALNQLEPEYREALTLRVIHGLSYAEIADTLEIREGTVKSRIARAREKMRAQLLGAGNISGASSSKKPERRTDAR